MSDGTRLQALSRSGIRSQRGVNGCRRARKLWEKEVEEEKELRRHLAGREAGSLVDRLRGYCRLAEEAPSGGRACEIALVRLPGGCRVGTGCGSSAPAPLLTALGFLGEGRVFQKACVVGLKKSLISLDRWKVEKVIFDHRWSEKGGTRQK